MSVGCDSRQVSVGCDSRQVSVSCDSRQVSVIFFSSENVLTESVDMLYVNLPCETPSKLNNCDH